MDPASKECYWQYINSDTVEDPFEQGKATFKIEIPKTQKLNEKSKDSLEEVALNQTMQEAKYNILLSIKYLIEEVEKGNEIILLCTEQIFEGGLGKAKIEVGIKDGDDTRFSDWNFYFDPSEDLPNSKIFKIYFSWCDVFIDKEFYEKRSKFKGLTNLVPYDDTSDAFRLYCFKISKLNEVGKSFLILDRYLNC